MNRPCQHMGPNIRTVILLTDFPKETHKLKLSDETRMAATAFWAFWASAQRALLIERLQPKEPKDLGQFGGPLYGLEWDNGKFKWKPQFQGLGGLS